MFGKFFNAKGKLYLGAIFSLCAVLLGCAVFAFAGIFGGREKLTNENISQPGESLTANAAPTISKSGNVWTVTATSCADMANAWGQALDASSETTTITFKLNSDWVAVGGKFSGNASQSADLKSTGGSTAVYSDGSICMPAGKSIILDLNGHKVDRALTKATAKSGKCFESNGNFTIRDTSSGKSGQITGNWSTAPVGAVNVVSGNFRFESGNITGNNSLGGAGIRLNGGTFTMTGGTISNNTSWGNSNFIDPGSSCGGAMFSTVPITITGGTFSGNKGCHGSAIDIRDYHVTGAETVISNVTFSNNTATGNGTIHSWCKLSMTNCTFTGNSGGNGAGIYTRQDAGAAQQGWYVKVNTSTFTNNTSTYGGAAIFADNYTNVELNGGTYTGNTGPAGAIYYVKTAKVSIKGNINVSGNKNAAGGSINISAADPSIPLYISGALSNTTKIGLYSSGMTTSGWQTYMGTAEPSTKFGCDQTGYEIKKIAISGKNEGVVVSSSNTKTLVAVPAAVAPTMYNGSQKTIITGYNTTYMNAPTSLTSGASVSGTNIVATKAGTYSATFALKNTSTTTWTDGTTEAKTVTAEIRKGVISFNTFADKTVTYNGSPQSITATLNQTTGVTLSYTYQKGSAAATATVPTDAGTYTVIAKATVNSSDTDNYTEASYTSGKAILTIKKSDLNITVFTYSTVTYGTKSAAPSKTIQRASTTTTITSGYGTVKYSIATGDQNSTAYPGTASIDATTGVLSPTKAGKIRVTISIEASTNYNAASKTVEVTIGKAQVNSITWGTTSKPYDGTALTASVSAFGTGNTFNCVTKPTVANLLTVAGTITNYTSGGVTATAKLKDTTNYEYASTVTNATRDSATQVSTKLTITQVTLTASSTIDGRAYNGTTDGTGTITLTGAKNNENPTATGTFTWKSKDAGTTNYDVTDIKLGSSWTTNYTVASTLSNKSNTGVSIGKVTLTPSVNTVASKTYNAGTEGSGTIKLSGAVNNESPTATGTFTWSSADAGTTGYGVTGIALGSGWTTNYQLSTTTLSGQTSSTPISKAQITGITWDTPAGGYSYDGNAKAPRVSSVTTPATAGLPATHGDMFDYTYTEKVLQGTHTATATLKSGYSKNYEITSTVTGNQSATSVTTAYTIGLATITLDELVTVAYGGTYDGKKHRILTGMKATTVGTGNNVTWYYSENNITATSSGWTVFGSVNDLPEVRDVTSKIYYFKAEAPNHAAKTFSRTVTITARSLGTGAGAVTGIGYGTVPEYTYDGTEHKFEPVLNDSVTGSDGGKGITAPVKKPDGSWDTSGADYRFTYNNVIAAGTKTAVLTVTGQGNYTGSFQILYTIKARDINITTINVTGIGDTVYNHGSQKQSPTVTDTVVNGGAALTEGTDYSVAYERPDGSAATDFVNVGTIVVKIDGKGNYQGSSRSLSYEITAYDLGTTPGIITFVAITNQTYTGTGIEPEPAVSAGFTSAATLVKGTDFTYSYSANVNVGTATVTITGAGNYKGTSSTTFTIEAKSINTIGGLTADNKVYDGTQDYENAVKANGSTEAAGVDVSGATFAGKYIADALEISEYTVKFDGKDAGTHTVTVTVTKLGGVSSSNYTIPAGGVEVVLTGITITPREIGITWGDLKPIYNNQAHCPTATATNVVAGEESTVILITQVKDGVSAIAPGPYTAVISVSNSTLPPNYKLPDDANALQTVFTITTENTQARIKSGSLETIYDGSAKQPAIEQLDDDTQKWSDVANDGINYKIKFTVISGGSLDASGMPVTAGTYSVTIELSPNYLWSDMTVGNQKTETFTIKPATIRGVKLYDVLTGVDYDGSAKTLAVDWTNADMDGATITTQPAGITVTYLYDGAAVAGAVVAGTHTVTARFTVDGNYNAITDLTATLVIAKKTINLDGVAFADNSTEYDGTKKSLEITGALDNLLSVTYLYEGAATDGVIAVGEYTVTAQLAFRNAADSDNYKIERGGLEISSLTAKLTVTAPEANVNGVTFADRLGVYYDGNVQRITVTGSATGITGVRYEYLDDANALVSTDGVKNAGTYTVKAIFTVDGNYDQSKAIEKTATLEIKPAALTVTADNKTIVYGDNPATQSYTATYTGIKGGDKASDLGTLNISVSAGKYAMYGAAGEYIEAIEVGGLSTSNYTVTYVKGTLTVKPRTIAVTWYNAQGSASQDMTYVYTEVGGTAVEHTPYAEVENKARPTDELILTVGGGASAAGVNYEATVTGVTGASASNYALPASGLKTTFDVLPQPKSGVIIWDNGALYYNGTEQAPKAYYYEDENDNTPKELTVTSNKRAIYVGDYVATASLGSNYELTGETSKPYSILKRDVYIELGDLSATLGNTDVSGVAWQYASGSLEIVAGEQYTLTFGTDTITTAGKYAIRATFTSANASNYEIHYIGSWSDGRSGTLTVSAGSYDMSKVTYTGVETTYDGSAHRITANNLPVGVTATYEYLKSGWSLGSAGVIDAGEYTVIVRFTGDSNYGNIPDAEVLLKVRKASLTVKVRDKSIVYGETPAFSASDADYSIVGASGALGGTLVISTDYRQYGDIGKYLITAEGLSSENYEITYVKGTLTVTARELEVTWYTDSSAVTEYAGRDYEWDGNAHMPYAVVTGGTLRGETVTLTVTVDGGAPSAAGKNYTARITTVSNANYAVKSAETSVTYSIIKKNTIIWDNSPLEYNGVDQAPTAYYVDESGAEIPLTVAVAGAHAEAGTYKAVVTSKPANVGGETELTYTITPKRVTVTLGAGKLTYGFTDAEKTAELSGMLSSAAGISGFVGGAIPVELSCAVTGKTGVGSYIVTGVGTDTKNYIITVVDGSLEIEKAAVDMTGVSLGDKTFVYDGKAHAIEITGGLPDGVTRVEYTYNDGATDVAASAVTESGTYTVTATFTVDNNHKLSVNTLTATLKINPATLSANIKFESASYVYDGTEKSVNASGDMTGVTGVTYTYNGVAASGATDVGTYTVTATFTVADTKNYTPPSPKSTTLTITAAALTVTADNSSVVYGESVDTGKLTYTATGLAYGDSITVTYIVGAYTGVKVYEAAITPQVSGAALSNYTLTVVKGDLTVTAREITVTGWQKSATDPDTVLEYEYTDGSTAYIPYAIAGNVRTGDTIGLSVTVSRSAAGESYVAEVTGITGADAGNYKLPVKAITTNFTIRYKNPEEHTTSVVWDYAAQYYDNTAKVPVAKYYDTSSGAYVAFGASDIALYDTDGNAVTSAINAGKYIARVTATGYTNTEYRFEIRARQVYIAISDTEAEYGSAINLGAIVYSVSGAGFLAGEEYTISFAIAGEVNGIGNYAIVGAYSSPNSSNYEVVFTGNWTTTGTDNGLCGLLTVVQAEYDMSKVTLAGTDVTYDGTAHTLTVNGLPDGVTPEARYVRSGFVYADGATEAGEYTVTITFKGDKNYKAIAPKTATVRVRKAALTIKANDTEITYGETATNSGVTYTGFAAGDSAEKAGVLTGGPVYGYGYTAGGNVGEYEITVGGYTSLNYEISYKSGTLKVVPKVITVTWYDDETQSARTFRYAYTEGKRQAPYAVAGGLVNGDAVTLEVTGAQEAQGVNYVATAVLSNANYALPADGTAQQSYTIIPRAGSLVWDNSRIYYDGYAHTPKAYTYDENGNATEVTGVTVTDSDDNPITSAINAGSYIATVVYNGETRTHVFRILPLEISITISDRRAEYGAAISLDQGNPLGWTYAKDSNAFISGSPVVLETLARQYSKTGIYEITGRCTDSNYSVTFTNGTLEITKATPDVSGIDYGTLSAGYDGMPHGLSVTGMPAGVSVICTYEKDGKTFGADGVREVGVYSVTIRFVIADTDNYNAVGDITKTFEITAATPDTSGITFADATSVYDGTAKSVYVSGNVQGLVSAEYTYYAADGVTAVAGNKAIAAGTYKVKATLKFDNNYGNAAVTLTDTATLTITPAALTVKADNYGVEYGESVNTSELTYTATGLAAGDSITVTYVVGAYTGVNVYKEIIAPQVSGAALANYTLTPVNGDLTVTPREITVTGWQKSASDAGNILEYEYTDGTTSYIPYAVAGRVLAGEDISLTVEISRSAAGESYVATVVGITGAAAGNYKLPASPLTTNFTVKYTDPENHITEVVWDYSAQYYNGTAKVPTAKYYDDVTKAYVAFNAADIKVYTADGTQETAAIHAGNYLAKVTASGYTNTEYAFGVLARKVYITIGDGESGYGETPDLTKIAWTYATANADNKFISGDSYGITLKTAATAASAIGRYAITAEYTCSSDYEVIFMGGSYATTDIHNGEYGTLEIVRAKYDMGKVTLTGTNAEYTGAANYVDVANLPSEEITYTIAYTRGGVATDGGKDAGEYAVTVTFTGNSNYEPIPAITGTLKITKATLTVTAENKQISYGGEFADGKVSYAGFKGLDNETVAGVLGGAAVFECGYTRGDGVGGYAITPKGLTATNYNITYVPGTLTVVPREITVTWYSDNRMNSQKLEYAEDGKEHLPYAEAGNLLPGDSVTLTVTGAQSKAGIDYRATIAAVGNPNYTVTAKDSVKNFSIIPAAYVIVWESAPFIYNGEEQKPKAYYYTATGAQVELNVTVDPISGLASASSIYAGEYTAHASLKSGTDVITGEFEHKFNINKREVTIIVNDATGVYGGEFRHNGWTYASADPEHRFVGTSEPVFLKCGVNRTSPVGSYVIDGEYTGADNSYDVKFIPGTYTVEKAVVSLPEITDKAYTGTLLKADISDTGIYKVFLNDGGIGVGSYKVILELTDYDNYKWQVNGEDVRSANVTVMFEITRAANAFTTEFAVKDIKPLTQISIVEPQAKFGSVTVGYFDKSGRPVDVTGNIWNAIAGEYIAKVTVNGTADYEGLEQSYTFTATGAYELNVYWGGLNREYDGTAWAPKAYVMLDGAETELEVTGAQTNAGSYTATATLKTKAGRDLSGAYAFSGTAKVNETFNILKRDITVHIKDMTSGYGTATLDVNAYNLYNCQIDGDVVGTDRLNLAFTCNFGADAFAKAGVYEIVGSCANGNYNVTFVGEDGSATGKYTVTAAEIRVLKNGTAWFDDKGVINEFQSDFITLGDTDDATGEYKNLKLMGGQHAKITYGTEVVNYRPELHDNMSESRIMMMFADGGQSGEPLIKQGGRWIVYYKVEAENHTPKYGIWKVEIEDPDAFIIITFTKPYTMQYGEIDAHENILPMLIEQNCITLGGNVIPNTTALLAYAEAYVYEDIENEADAKTGVGRYTIRLNLNGDGEKLYGGYSFKYSGDNATPDTNTEKFVVAKRNIGVTWTDTEFTANGGKQLPKITLSGFVGGQSVELSNLADFEIGKTLQIVLANGDVIDVTVNLTDGDATMSERSYNLQVVIDGENYTVDAGSGSKLIVINPAAPEPESGVKLPTWAIILIACGGAAMLLILIIAIVVAKKRKALPETEDFDGFNDDYTG